MQVKLGKQISRSAGKLSPQKKAKTGKYFPTHAFPVNPVNLFRLFSVRASHRSRESAPPQEIVKRKYASLPRTDPIFFAIPHGKKDNLFVGNLSVENLFVHTFYCITLISETHSSISKISSMFVRLYK